MARLNTATPAKPTESPSKPRIHRLADRNAFARSEFRDRATAPRLDESQNREQWAMRGGETASKKRTTGTTDKPPQGRIRLQRSRTISDMSFDIFADSDGMSERGGNTPSKEKTATPLKLARTNSLLLPRTGSIPQLPRPRISRKSELYNYDKENDPLEEELDPEEPPSLSRNPSDASSSSARRSPVRNRNTGQFTNYRQPEPVSDNESRRGEDDSFNSLDDFIVSDREELSYHEMSDDETEEEQFQAAPSPPRTTRRLMRGRRPDPTAELMKALQRSSQKQDLRLEPSLPSAITMPSPSPEDKPRRTFQRGMSVSERMNGLNLEDNDPSPQLQQDLYDFAVDVNSPSQKSRSNQFEFQTPPSSPTKGRLRSSTKQKVHIPPTPYRESVDAFWSQKATVDWIDHHSPRKLDSPLQEFDESECDSESDSMGRRSRSRKEVKTPSKRALKKAETEEKRAAQARKKSFDNRKAVLAEEFFKVLDDAVADGQVQKRSKETGGVRIIWSKTLQTTAGRASWKKVAAEASSRDNEAVGRSPHRHHAVIELAERIIDNEDRLINTLAHEYCHLANYIISNVHNNPHGTSFKQWGRKCKDALKHHPVYGGRVEVTTKHSYKIDYKYVWSCVDCGQTYGRHSKSINTTKSSCGKCHGLLQQIKPKPRNVSPKKKPQTTQVEDVVKVLEEVSLYN